MLVCEIVFLVLWNKNLASTLLLATLQNRHLTSIPRPFSGAVLINRNSQGLIRETEREEHRGDGWIPQGIQMTAEVPHFLGQWICIPDSRGGSRSSQVLDKKGRGGRLILCPSKLRLNTVWMQQLEGAYMEQCYEKMITFTEADKWSIINMHVGINWSVTSQISFCNS